MAAARLIKRILWAVDAFDPPSDILSRTVRTLRQLSEKFEGAVIEPVYVLSPSQLNLSTEFSSPWLVQYRVSARQALEKLLKSVHLEGLAPARVLVRNLSSTSAVVKALSEYAVSSNADLVVASTHGRSGFSRLILGSFAETLLYRSKVPVVVVGPEMTRKSSFDHILFPTDFGPFSRNNFRYVVKVAKQLGSKLTLYHSVPQPIEPVFQSGVYLLGGSWIPVQAYFNKEVDRRQRHAERWVAWARNQGVPTELVMDTQGGGISEHMLGLIGDQKISLVMMEAHSGPLTAALVGSITREVVRHAQCPVWVMHPMASESSLRRGGSVPRAA
jgi:nucleotide-binding universal stress UspA family protein